VSEPPPIRDALRAAGLSADKSFGQHFLLDLNICRKIVRLAGSLDGETVIEVGPGPGGLTRALLEAGARVIAIEADARFLPLLAELPHDGRLTVVHADALKADEAALVGPGGARVVSNLPYNVGTALLIKWLTGPFRPRSMTLMFQKEVAERIVAPVGGEAYGRLAVIAQTLCETRIVMSLPARAFTPPPKVDSAVVELIPRANPPSETLIEALQVVTREAFGQRRKMLRSALKAIGGEGLCAAAGIDATLRGEAIDLAGFMRLAETLKV
jgi:16S rRNA (adenine1518-N6/adenine1519-N6)-dimethyltransferase